MSNKYNKHRGKKTGCASCFLFGLFLVAISLISVIIGVLITRLYIL